MERFHRKSPTVWKMLVVKLKLSASEGLTNLKILVKNIYKVSIDGCSSTTNYNECLEFLYVIS